MKIYQYIFKKKWALMLKITWLMMSIIIITIWVSVDEANVRIQKCLIEIHIHSFFLS